MKSEDLEQQIDRISSTAGAASAGNRVDWRDLWNDIKAVGAAFKETDFASRDEREQLWSRFQAAVDEVKAEQARQRQRREHMADGSSRHLDHIRSLVDAAAPDDGLWRIMLTLFSGGTNLLVEAALDSVFGKHDEVFAELHRRSALLREAGQYLSANKGEMLGADKAAAFNSIKSGRERLDEDWARWKSAIAEAKAARHQQYLERQARREERNSRQQAWRENQVSFIARLEGALEKLESARGRRREHLAELCEKRATAWSEGFRDRVDGWISEEESNIADIEDKIRDVANKLEEAKGRL